jgi:hypothetical protein
MEGRNHAMRLTTFKPAGPRSLLVGLAGVMWSGVGVMLCRLAYVWLTAVRWGPALAYGGAGIAFALTAYRFSFSKIARKNINRLCQLSDKACIFAFQAWRGYVIIGVMIMLGVVLRHSLLPKPYLAIVYLAIGGALLLSSRHYYGCLWKMLVRKHPCRVSES